MSDFLTIAMLVGAAYFFYSRYKRGRRRSELMAMAPFAISSQLYTLRNKIKSNFEDVGQSNEAIGQFFNAEVDVEMLMVYYSYIFAYAKTKQLNQDTVSIINSALKLHIKAHGLQAIENDIFRISKHYSTLLKDTFSTDLMLGNIFHVLNSRNIKLSIVADRILNMTVISWYALDFPAALNLLDKLDKEIS